MEIDPKEFMDDLNNIDRVINDFTGQFGCTAKLGEIFLYLPHVNHINYELDFGGYSRTHQKMNRDFMNSVKRCKPQIKLNVFMWSLLHEIGHHHTYYDFTEDEIDRFTKKVHRIEKTKSSKPYYDLPYERAATEWAVNYANTHQKEVLELWEKIKDALSGICKSLGASLE